MIFKKNSISRKPRWQILREFCEGLRVVRGHVFAQRSKRDEPVEGAAVEAMETKRLGKTSGNGSLARGRRAVHGDHGRIHAVSEIRASDAK